MGFVFIPQARTGCLRRQLFTIPNFLLGKDTFFDQQKYVRQLDSMITGKPMHYARSFCQYYWEAEKLYVYLAFFAPFHMAK
jgi:hypothetical protein